MLRSTLWLFSVSSLLLLAACREELPTPRGDGALEVKDQSVIIGRTAFPDDFGAYPRLVRMEKHPTAKGALIGTFETWGARGATFYRSDDDGQSWRHLSTVVDPTLPRLCCSTLYELPQALGTLPAGTLLWATTAGEIDTGMNLRIWTPGTLLLPGRWPGLSPGAEGRRHRLGRHQRLCRGGRRERRRLQGPVGAPGSR
ncbi:hypothetical protein [Archangium sp.]|uniref:hypothetical protein n=1 Tax=Archangium sp. TaxID=1872627 RepID=UPI002D48F12A|nr:hypothetical protein [Archangium sp.]HYO52054.1 hypothetical protein [Archangium sp.]